MNKIFIVAVFAFIVVGCGDSNKTQNDEVEYLSFEDENIGSDEWKLKEIQSIKSDSATLKDTDYKEIAKGTNSEMSYAIDFLSSHTPTWSGFREAYKDFYLNDKRASVPIEYIVKNSKNKLNQVLPTYRKRFADNLAKSLWEQDIYVTASGSQNTILNMTGGIFAANQNIADMESIIERDAKHFGFKQVRYRWYKGANEYTSYTLSK